MTSRRTVFTVLTTFLIFLASTATRAQRFALDSHHWAGATIGSHSYDVASLNTALGEANFPVVESGTITLGIVQHTRKAGRHQFGSGLEFNLFYTGGSKFFNEEIRSVDLGAAALYSSYHLDLLYPSAWNVLVGVNVGVLGGRLTTRSVANDFSGGSPSFDLAAREAKFNFAAIFLTPELTLQTIEVPLAKQPARFQFSLGYRIGFEAELSRDGYADIPYSLALGTSGLSVKGGVVFRVPSLGELLKRSK